jgi:hypothetical protein
VASPENVELHESEVEAFLESLINHVTSQSRILSLRHPESQKLIHLKHLYDMLSFIARYRRSFISDKFLEQNKQLIRVFEEAVGLMSNIMHLIIIRKNAYYEELKAGGTLPNELQKVSQESAGLMGPTHRKIILSFVNSIGDYQISQDFQVEVNLSTNLFESRIKPSIPKFLNFNPVEIRSSIQNCKEQYRRFYIQQKILKDKTQFPNQNFLQLVTDFPTISVTLVKGFEFHVKNIIEKYT